MARKPTPTLDPLKAPLDAPNSLAALRFEHLDFMARAVGTNPPSGQEITELLQKLKAALEQSASELDQGALSRMIDYWQERSGEAGLGRQNEAPLGAATEPDSGQQFEADSEGARQASTYIRLAALARQWQESGGSKGYLLTDKALKEAEGFVGYDDDIRKLVEASQHRQRSTTQRTLSILAGTVVLLLALLALAGLLYLQANRNAELARQSALEATASAKQEEIQRLAAEASAAEARQLADGLRLQRVAAEQARDNDARRSGRLVALLTDAIVEKVSTGALPLDELAPEVRSTVLASIETSIANRTITKSSLPATVQVALYDRQPDVLAELAASSLLNGYDPSIVGVPLPVPAKQASAELYEAGTPIPYVNYSLVLDQQRRIALLAAINLNRERRVALPGADLPFKLDSRVPVEAQSADSWFGPGPEALAPGVLAPRDFVSWGPVFSAPDALEGRLDRVVLVSTNRVPQLAGFNRSGWTALQQWILTQHNPIASQVTVLAGPVLKDDDPVINGARTPRGYWAIAISNRSRDLLQTSADPAALVVDAFVVQQLGVEGDASAGNAAFNPDIHRVSVAMIAALTGLDFGPAVMAADAANAQPSLPGPSGAPLSERIAELDAPDASTRQVVVQDMVDAFRNDKASAADQRLLVEQLSATTRSNAIAGWSLNGRYNLLFVLSQVPAATWQQPDWADLRAKVSDDVRAFEAAAVSGSFPIGPQTRSLLDQLKRNLNVAEPTTGDRPPVTVYFQFAGMTRSAAETVSGELQQLGWTIPGEERTEAAVGVNEVRFNPISAEDGAAAQQLVTDLKNAGYITQLARNPRIEPGFLEVWISK
jgi:DNA/RNA endonuclease G (NUC1)